MAEREGGLRKKLRLPSGLIARVEGTAGPYGMTTRNAKPTAKARPGLRKRVLA
jgi:hypothetical protein